MFKANEYVRGVGADSNGHPIAHNNGSGDYVGILSMRGFRWAKGWGERCEESITSWLLSRDPLTLEVADSGVPWCAPDRLNLPA